MHLNFNDTVSLTGLTSSAFDVETETARLVTAHAGFGRFGEEFSNKCKNAGVGAWIGPWGSSDGRLIDIDDFVNIFESLYATMVTGRYPLKMKSLCQDVVKGFKYKCRFPWSRNTGDTDKTAQGERYVDILKIIFRRPLNNEFFLIARSPGGWDGNIF